MSNDNNTAADDNDHGKNSLYAPMSSLNYMLLYSKICFGIFLITDIHLTKILYCQLILPLEHEPFH